MSEMLPLFPLTTVLFPGMRLPLHVFEERYVRLVRDLLDRSEPRQFGVIAIRKGRETGEDGISALYDIGCVATVRKIESPEDDRYDLATVGTRRFRLIRLDRSLPYLQGEIEMLPDETGTAETGSADTGSADTGSADTGSAQAAFVVHRVQTAFRAYLNGLADRGGGVISVPDLPDEPLLLSYVVGAAMIIDLPERQSLLASPDAVARLRAERSMLAREIGILRATTSRPAPDFSHGRHSPN